MHPDPALIFAVGMVAGTGLGLLIAAFIGRPRTAEPAADPLAGLTPDERALADMIGRDIATLPLTVHAPARLHRIDDRHLGSDLEH